MSDEFLPGGGGMPPGGGGMPPGGGQGGGIPPGGMPPGGGSPPRGIPNLDTEGTSVPGDPFSMVAPGGPDPEEDIPEDVIHAYQEDLVARAMLWMSDQNIPEGRDMSAADAVIKRLNIRGSNAPEAVGGTAAEMILGITQNAKRQGVEYPAPSVLAGGIEVVQLLMDMSRESGVFPDMPEDEGSEEYEQMTTVAALEAAKYYGERMIATGQVSQEEFAEILTEKMEEEAALGELDDWDPMQMMGPQDFSNLLERGLGQKAQRQQQQEETQQGPPQGPPPEQGPMQGGPNG